MDSRIISQKFESVIRRELLKRTPVVVREAYNPLQKHVYTFAIGARGFVRADRFRDMEAAAIFLAGVDDRRFHWARLWHFLIMWALLAFVFGHLVMVVLHG